MHKYMINILNAKITCYTLTMRVQIVTDDTTRPEDRFTFDAAENFGKATDTNIATTLHNRWTAIRSDRSCTETSAIRTETSTNKVDDTLLYLLRQINSLDWLLFHIST